MYFCFIFCFSFLVNGVPVQQSSGYSDTDNGNIQIQPSNFSFVYAIHLQNMTGIRMQLKNLTKETILLFPEQNMTKKNLQPFRVARSNEFYNFEGKSLVIVVPPRQKAASFNWTGLNPDESKVSFTTKFEKDFEGTLAWEKTHDGDDRISWGIEFRGNGQLNWTLETVLPECGFYNPCESISFALFLLKANGNVTEIKRSCKGSSTGSLKVERNSHVLLLLHVNSSVYASSSMNVTWTSELEHPTTTEIGTTQSRSTVSRTTESTTTKSTTTKSPTTKGPTTKSPPTERQVDGILAGTYGSGLYAISFLNPLSPTKLSSESVQGLAFNWNTRKAYWAEGQRGIFRANLDGSGKEEIINDPDVRGIAIEPMSGNFYYGSWNKKAIIVCDKNAQRCSNIVEVENIYDIALHPSKGFLFWSIWGAKMVQAKLDGTNSVDTTYSTVYGIGVDELEDRIYWSADSDVAEIKSSNLNGGDFKRLKEILTETGDVEIEGDRVYYTKNGIGAPGISFTGKQGVRSTSLVNLPDKARYLAMFGTPAPNLGANPCQSVKCAYFCILMSATTHRCICPDGKSLQEDGVTCGKSALSWFMSLITLT